MLYKFTSSTGRVNYGLVIETLENGYSVFKDDFEIDDDLIIPARFVFVSNEKNQFVMGKTSSEILPIETVVSWRNSDVENVAKLMQQGKFADWWQKNSASISVKYLRSNYR